MTQPARRQSNARSGGERARTPAFGDWLSRVLQQTATLSLAIFGFLFCLLSSYSLNLNTTRLVLTAVVLILGFAVLYSSRRWGILLLVAVLAAVLWGFLNADPLVQGLLLLVDQALRPLSLSLPDATQSLLRAHDAMEALRYSTLALQAILFLVTLSAGFFVVCQPSAVGLALSTLPLLLPAPFYLLSPSIPAFFCLVAALLMVYVLNGIRSSSALSLPISLSPRAGRKSEGASQRSLQHLLALALIPLIAFVVLLSQLVLPEEGYVRPEAIEQLQQEIFSLELGKNSILKSNDGLTHGDLRDLSTIRFTGATALKIRTTLEEPMYLRDFAGASFTNDGWSSVSEADYAAFSAGFLDIAPLNLCFAAASIASANYDTYTVSVRNISAAKTSIWVPSGLRTSAVEIPNSVYLEDAALGFSKASAAADYTVSALNIGSSLSSIPLGEDTGASSLKAAYQLAAGSAMGLSRVDGAEAQRVKSAANAYIDYVFQAYGRLPESTMQAAQKLLRNYGLTAQGNDNSLSLYETCRALYLFLSERCVYAYSPPQPPSGADFATYFLEESRQGYCVHFATTATVLLRALGIPARYAEGYIVIPDDFEKQPDADGYISIEDTHAHAWVEVFDPVQLEWIPIEMTASTGSNPSTAENDLGDAETSASPEPTPTAEPEDTPEPSSEPSAEPTSSPSSSGEPTIAPDGGGTPEPTEAPEGAASESPEASPSPAPGGSDDAGSPEGASSQAGDSAERPRLWPLFALGLAGLAVLGAFGLRKLAVKRLQQRFFQRDLNAAALALCRYTLDLLRFAGCEPLAPLQYPAQYAQAAQAALPWLDRAALLRTLDLAQRARFSGKMCSRSERDEAFAFARNLRAALPARLPKLRRLWLRLRFPAI